MIKRLRFIAPLLIGFAFCLGSASAQSPNAPPPSPGERATATPALWKASDEDTTVWLFGSFHILPPQLDWRTAAFEAAFAEAETVFFELPIGPETEAEVGRIAMTLGFSPNDRAAGVVLSGPDWTRLKEAAARFNIPESAVRPMRPWFASVMLSVQAIVAEGFDPESGVDKRIAAQTAAEGKAMDSFETPAEQLGFSPISIRRRSATC